MTDEELEKYRGTPLSFIEDDEKKSEIISSRLVRDLKRLICKQCELYNLDEEHLKKLVEKKWKIKRNEKLKI